MTEPVVMIRKCGNHVTRDDWRIIKAILLLEVVEDVSASCQIEFTEYNDFSSKRYKSDSRCKLQVKQIIQTSSVFLILEGMS